MSSGFPQAKMTFSAIPEMIGGTATMSRGISPGIILLEMPTKPSLTTTVGTLQITYPGVNIRLPNCAVNTHTLKREIIRSSTYARRADSRMWTIQVMDRRWAWRYKKIEGEYNVRMPNNDVRFSNTHLELRKSIFDLAVLCLSAMGESGFDCSVLPRNVYPYVNWKKANPAAELQTLCDMVGCVVVYDWDLDRVVIHRLGVGANLPTGTGTDVHQPMPVSVTRRPDKIAVECGPTRFQIQFELEAVGMEFDGTINRLSSISYVPAAASGGWGKQWWCDFPNVSAADKDMAFRTIFRWYRVKAVGTSGILDVPGVNETIKSIDQFELEDILLEHKQDPDLMPQTQRGRIVGEFWPQCPWEAVTAAADSYNSSGWRILPDHKNIVEFDYPVLKITSGSYEQAKLFLTCVCKIRKANADGYVSASYSQNLPWAATGAGTRILKHQELWDSQIINRVAGTAGVKTASAEASVYLSYTATVYNSGAGIDMGYDGILPIRLDGAIAQVQWKAGLGAQGKTRASRNHEFDIFTPPMEQRRRQEKTNTAADMELL